jgi:hypothetical protein
MLSVMAIQDVASAKRKASFDGSNGGELEREHDLKRIRLDVDSDVTGDHLEVSLGLKSAMNTAPPSFKELRIVPGKSFNLFGIKSLPVSTRSLHPDDETAIELWLGENLQYHAAELDKSVTIGDLLAVTKDTPVGAIVLNDVKVVYQVSWADDRKLVC